MSTRPRRGPSILRTAHGNGADAILRAETPPIDELPPVNAAIASQGNAELARRGRPFERGNQAAKGRKPGLALMGLPIATADPRYRSALRKARTYMQRRAHELAAVHGGYLGAGPSAMLVNAAFALAASRVLSELASETLDAKLFRDAAALADSARQQELTAVALAEREAAARPVSNPHADLAAALSAPRQRIAPTPTSEHPTDNSNAAARPQEGSR